MKSGNGTEQKQKSEPLGEHRSNTFLLHNVWENPLFARIFAFFARILVLYYDYTLREYLIRICSVEIPDAWKLENSIIHAQITNWLIAFHFGQIFDVAHKTKIETPIEFTVSNGVCCVRAGLAFSFAWYSVLVHAIVRDETPLFVVPLPNLENDFSTVVCIRMVKFLLCQ